jgi:hypothetical protein
MTEDGKIQFDSNFLDLDPIITCGNTTLFADSYDSGTVSNVPVAQCSVAGFVSADEECTSEENPFGGWPCIDGLRAASTKFGTELQSSLTEWSCAFDGTSGTCDSQPGQFRRVRKHVDGLTLQSIAFDNGAPQPVSTATGKSEVWKSDTDTNGVCAEGTANENGLSEVLRTSAGLTSSHQFCP